MNLSIRGALLFISIVVAGCATTSGVLRAGQNSYTVTASASMGGGGASAAKSSAYAQANTECVKQNKTISVTGENASVPGWNDGMYTVNLRFDCV